MDPRACFSESLTLSPLGLGCLQGAGGLRADSLLARCSNRLAWLCLLWLASVPCALKPAIMANTQRLPALST